MVYSFKGCLPFYPILPTQYSDALSYYEEIRLLQECINKLAEEIDQYGDNVLGEAKSYTDQEVKALNVALRDMITAYSIKYEGDIKDLQNQYIELNIAISRLYKALNDNVALMDAKFILLKQELYNYIDKLLKGNTPVYVVNPTTGKFDLLQKVLDDMYKALSWGTLTAGEYDRLLLTAKQYDDLKLTAYQYDHWAKINMFDTVFFRMRSPFTGRLDFYSNVIYSLARLHQNPLTAIEYDNLGLSADSYDTMDITAYEYDWDGKAHLGG